MINISVSDELADLLKERKFLKKKKIEKEFVEERKDWKRGRKKMS